MSFSKSLGLLALCLSLGACTTLGVGRQASTPAVATQTPTQNAASSELIRALDGGLITKFEAAPISRADRISALQSEYRALEYTAPGEAVLWQGSAISGRVVPSQPYRVGSQDCRQYEHIILNAGQAQSAKGTACRNADGTWSLLS